MFLKKMEQQDNRIAGEAVTMALGDSGSNSVAQLPRDGGRS